MGEHSCCAPTGDRGGTAPATTAVLEPQPFSSEGMVLIPAGEFLMGSAGPEAWVADGEGPVHEVSLPAYWIDECAVTNEQFAQFADATGYVTEGERFGWSFVHYSQISKQQRKVLEAFRVAGLEWWFRVDGSDWRHPLGPKADYQQLRRGDHPVVHVSWNDAAAYAQWRGKRLPGEAEWECASRGGLVQKLYPWGDELVPAGKHRCNIWQGEFPSTTAETTVTLAPRRRGHSSRTDQASSTPRATCGNGSPIGLAQRPMRPIRANGQSDRPAAIAKS